MKILDGLDDAQRAAVLAGRGLVRVKAGAGTGKTRVLTTRIVHLVTECGADPQRIQATTFTNKAAREMRERAEMMGGNAVAGARFSTLHAMAARILRRHWQAAGLRSASFNIADDDEAAAIMAEAVDASGVLGPTPQEPDSDFDKVRRGFVKSCLQRISRWKENGLYLDEVRDAQRKRRSQADEDFAAVYVAYQDGLDRRNLVDFGDLTMMAVRLLDENPEILEQEADAQEWLLVDEFQDTNQIQLRLIALLASRWGNLMVVGDDDQSLYSFRGAIPNLMDRLLTFLGDLAQRGVTDVALVTNRRCTDAILSPANLLVDYNTRDDQKVLRSGRDGDPVTVAGHPSDKAEAEDTAERAAKLIASGVAPEKIAILGRSAFVLEPVGRAFMKARLPHSMQAGTAFLERSEVRDVLAYLKLAVDPGLDLAFQRIAARPTRGLGVSAVEAILALARSRQLAIHDALSLLADVGGFKAEGRKGAALLGRQLSTLADAAGRGERSEDIVHYVLQEIGYAAWAYEQKEPPRTLRSSLEGLVDLAREQPDFTEFLTDICLLADPEERSTEGVHIGTLHGSKGLEWDHVFIVGFEEGILPNQRALEEAAKGGDPDDRWNTLSCGGIEEERRLAHVGLTRARHSAHISFCALRGVGLMRKPARPSRFLREAELSVPRVSQSFAAAKAANGNSRPKRKKPAFW